MQKILNNPLAAADELLEGLVDYYNGSCQKVGTRSIVKTHIPEGKVSVLVGGGAGHEPIYHGMVGENMADGAACGDIFAAPAPNIVLEATEAVNRNNGVLYLYGNYAGDVLNFDLAAEQAAEQGIEIQTVLIADDVASAPPSQKHNRRGIAGLVPIVKLACAASQKVDNLAELVAITESACLQTKSIGASLAPGSIPATGKPTFELEPGRVGLGLGIHGEQGVDEFDFTSADEIADMMLQFILDDFEKDPETKPLVEGDEIVLVINSLGATTMMELLILMRRAKVYFTERGIKLFDIAIGSFVTCQEMAGVSFSITRMDETLKPLWSMQCESICYSKLEGPTEGAKQMEFTSSTVSSAKKSRVAEVEKRDFSKSASGLSIVQAREMILKVADAIIESEPILTDADRALGDGDHGLGMQRGFTALKAELSGTDFDSLSSLFSTAGNALLTTMGGASGVIFGSLFTAGNVSLKGSAFFGTHELANLLTESLAVVMKRGGAKPGDKTMIDALAPAAEVARNQVDVDLLSAFAATAEAAEAGKEHSKTMIATMGRAKTLGEKTVGLPDAGAISVSIILRTMKEFAEKEMA